MKQPFTIYEKPTCSTCRNVMKVFQERGIDFEKINYVIEPPAKATLAKIVAGLDVPARSLIRTNEEEWKSLGLDIAAMSDAQIVECLLKHPAIMQRPVIEHNGKFIVGRPVEKVETFLDELKK